MTTATIPQTTSTAQSMIDILRLLATRGGDTIIPDQVLTRRLWREGLVERHRPLGNGLSMYSITPAGQRRLARFTRPDDAELRAALDVLVAGARANAAHDYAGRGVPRLRRALQRCAWHHADFRGKPFPYPTVLEWLELAGHVEPVTTWLSGSKWVVGWALTTSGTTLWRNLRTIPARRALIVRNPTATALVPAGFFDPPAPCPANPTPRKPFSTDRVKIGRGSWDRGAWHRAIEIARRLYDAGRWDGRGTLTIHNTYRLHQRLFGIERLSATALVVGQDYEIN